MFSKDYFKDYSYKKHAKLCGCIYGALIAFDMTVSYVIIKKYLEKHEL